MFLSHKVSYTVSLDGVPSHQRAELSRRLRLLREELRQQSTVRQGDLNVTLACPAHGPGYLLAVVDGQQYSVTPPDAWWCLLLGWSAPCEGGAHVCEKTAHGQACVRCGALRETSRTISPNAAEPWLHVGSDEHRAALRRVAQGALDGGRWPLAMFADEGELYVAAADAVNRIESAAS